MQLIRKRINGYTHILAVLYLAENCTLPPDCVYVCVCICHKGYGLATKRMHQLRGHVVCFKQKKTTGANSGYGTTIALSSLLASSSTSCTADPASCSRCPTSSSIAASHPGDGTVSELESAPGEDTPTAVGRSSSVIMAVEPYAVRENEKKRISVTQVKRAFTMIKIQTNAVLSMFAFWQKQSVY